MQEVELPDFRPVRKSYADLDIEKAIHDAIMSAMVEYIRPLERTLFMYALPQRAAFSTLELFAKSSGLGLYRADLPNIEPYIRHLYRVAVGLHPTGELGLLDIFLQTLFPNQYRIVRMWHRTDAAYPYPTGILDEEIPQESFLTSRVHVYLDPDAINSPFAGRIVPALQSVVGFQILLKVFMNAPAEPEDLGMIPIVEPFTVMTLEDQDLVAYLEDFTNA